jgi:hypothetical protein
MAKNIEVLIQVLKEGDEARRMGGAGELVWCQGDWRALECGCLIQPRSSASLAALATPVIAKSRLIPLL